MRMRQRGGIECDGEALLAREKIRSSKKVEEPRSFAANIAIGKQNDHSAARRATPTMWFRLEIYPQHLRHSMMRTLGRLSQTFLLADKDATVIFPPRSSASGPGGNRQSSKKVGAKKKGKK